MTTRAFLMSRSESLVKEMTVEDVVWSALVLMALWLIGSRERNIWWRGE